MQRLYCKVNKHSSNFDFLTQMWIFSNFFSRLWQKKWRFIQNKTGHHNDLTLGFSKTTISNINNLLQPYNITIELQTTSRHSSWISETYLRQISPTAVQPFLYPTLIFSVAAPLTWKSFQPFLTLFFFSRKQITKRGKKLVYPFKQTSDQFIV